MGGAAGKGSRWVSPAAAPGVKSDIRYACHGLAAVGGAERVHGKAVVVEDAVLTVAHAAGAVGAVAGVAEDTAEGAQVIAHVVVGAGFLDRLGSGFHHRNFRLGVRGLLHHRVLDLRLGVGGLFRHRFLDFRLGVLGLLDVSLGGLLLRGGFRGGGRLGSGRGLRGGAGLGGSRGLGGGAGLGRGDGHGAAGAAGVAAAGAQAQGQKGGCCQGENTFYHDDIIPLSFL